MNSGASPCLPPNILQPTGTRPSDLLTVQYSRSGHGSCIWLWWSGLLPAQSLRLVSATCSQLGLLQCLHLASTTGPLKPHAPCSDLGYQTCSEDIWDMHLLQEPSREVKLGGRKLLNQQDLKFLVLNGSRPPTM